MATETPEKTYEIGQTIRLVVTIIATQRDEQGRVIHRVETGGGLARFWMLPKELEAGEDEE